MTTIYQSPIWTIYWHEDSKMIQFVFMTETEDMTDEEYLHELKQYLPLLEQYRPQKILADTRNSLNTIVPEMQEWINENILTLYAKVGVKKHAVLVSSDIFTVVSIEQTMDEDKTGAFLNQYFEAEEDATK